MLIAPTQSATPMPRQVNRRIYFHTIIAASKDPSRDQQPFEQNYAVQKTMSALPPKWTFAGPTVIAKGHVRFIRKRTSAGHHLVFVKS